MRTVSPKGDSPQLLYVLVALFDGGNVGEELIQGVLEDDQLFPDGLELGNGVETLVNTVTVVADLGLGCIQLQALFFDEIVHAANHLDVVRRVVSDVLFVALGLDDGELTLPVSQCGFWDTKYLGYITDFIEFFVQFLHGLAQIVRIDYLCGLIIALQR